MKKKDSKKLTPERIKDLLNIVRKNNEGKKAFRVENDDDRRIYKNGLSPDKYLLLLEDVYDRSLENVDTINQLIPNAIHGKDFNRKQTPVSQESEQQKDFAEWAEINRDLIIVKVRKEKRGWKSDLFKLMSENYPIAKPTFYRLLKKFEKNLK